MVGSPTWGPGVRRERQRVEQEVGAEVDEPGAELTGGFVVADLRGRPCVDRAGVEALLDLHDADAGLVVAGENGALDRGGAAPARQQ